MSGSSDSIAKRREAGLSQARRFIEGPLRRALGWGDGPIHVQAPEAGIHSLLYFAGPVGAEGSERVMARVFEKTKRRALYRRGLRLADRHDLPTPRLVYCGFGLIERWRYGMQFVVTTVAPGLPLDEQPVTPRLRRAVAHAVARLHRAESGRWGEPAWRPRSRSYAEQYRQGVEKRLGRMEALENDLPAGVIDALRQWFAPHLERLGKLSRFQLCHLHLHGDDILYDPDSNCATAIDCMSLQFNRASCDLPNIRMSQWIGGEADWLDFLEHYFAKSPPERRAEYEEEGPFYEAYLFLRRLGKQAEREAGKNDGPVRFTEGKRSENWRGLMRATRID